MAVSLSIVHRRPISPYEQQQRLDRGLLERSEQPISGLISLLTTYTP